ncbi:MAG TPA: peptidylprolyl isomerase [Candidatus Limnocylindria bacterium]|jgi:peptidyl-prolyl cis-trans isomerase A (cyclophilin A)|nr:peptidylprolyl isomerase [Candidatus Limnocylindria bacterium]
MQRLLRFLAPAAAALLLAAAPHPRTVDVAIQTTQGTIVVRLDAAHAPITTANFLHYVDTKAYDDTSFYRTVSRAHEPQASIQVIQGGLNANAGGMLRPIPLEPTSKTGLHNTDGVISMARTSDPNSATTEFFICVGDDRFLDAGGPTGPGYAAFGKVVRGMNVVHRIIADPAAGESLTPPVRIVRITRVR